MRMIVLASSRIRNLYSSVLMQVIYSVKQLMSINYAAMSIVYSLNTFKTLLPSKCEVITWHWLYYDFYLSTVMPPADIILHYGKVHNLLLIFSGICKLPG